MKTTEHIIPPALLYKYRRIDCEYTKKILSLGEIYFSPPSTINDPCENFFMFDNEEHNGYCNLSDKTIDALELPRSCIKNSTISGNLCLLSPEQKTKLFMYSINKNNTRGILSLSERNDIMQMYAYYAGSSTGICIGFEWEKFELIFDGSYPTERNIPRKINYTSEPPLIKNSCRPEDWLSVFTTKANNFSFESEWRMFYIKDRYSDEKIRQATRSITFGPNFFSQKQKKWEHDLLNVINLTDGLNIDFYISEPILGKYKLQIKPFDYHSYL